ncbi:metallophosphoesterase family protein [Halobellus litoreus]|uniref:Metallophosphoesterase n=1 Tax=Halobellus litoreus TaxID=755310 RepID=A0ABD6DTA3_9EURY|nr:metallophosphoesterase [Halobellus litoreus]
MVRLLLLGDLHLSTTGPPIPPAVPDLETLDVDAVVSIGDVIDDNADHADGPEAGARYERRGRAFFERLNGLGVPVLAVPGNHDPIACTRRLADGLANVDVLHRADQDDAWAGTATVEGVRFVGWGCEQFDLTPAFAYDEYPGIVADLETAASPRRAATRTATAVESVVSRFLDGRLDAEAAAAELGVEPGRRSTCADELEALADEFEELREQLDGGSAPTVLLAHESPFHVAFDYHHAADDTAGQLHRGSIPIKMAIAAAAPDVVCCGHMHRRGRDVVETTGGHADVYNPGSPGASIVEIDETGALRVVD